MNDVTQILDRIERGDPAATDELLPLVYDALRRLARQKLAREKPGHTLQATALVHEAWMRLWGGSPVQHWDGRNHFFAVAGEAMRRLLVEQARRKAARKRGGDLQRVGLDVAEAQWAMADNEQEVLAVHDALDRLALNDPCAANLVKLRYFSGFSVEEAAELLGVSRASAYRTWTYARTWLHAELRDARPGKSSAGT